MNLKVSKVNRLIAVIIDSLVASIPAIILSVILGKEGIASFIGAIVFLLRDAFFGGQSIGKKVMKYKVVKIDGSSLSGDYKASVIRNVSIYIPLIDMILVLMDKNRLGDDWAKTKVINQ